MEALPGIMISIDQYLWHGWFNRHPSLFPYIFLYLHVTYLPILQGESTTKIAIIWLVVAVVSRICGWLSPHHDPNVSECFRVEESIAVD